jgi:hypothetical protein
MDNGCVDVIARLPSAFSSVRRHIKHRGSTDPHIAVGRTEYMWVTAAT